jgi:microcystin degradation protein MlrC
MVTQQHDDGEAELLRRLRAGPASDIPIAVSLDLHANLSARFVERCDVITIYRTYPHLDMALTGTRCMQRLLRCLNGEKLHHAFRQSSYLVPLHAQFTGAEPCQMLYEQVRQLADENRHEYLELAMGFTAADIADCGPSVVASAPTAERAAVLADTMIERFEQAEPVFDTRLYRPDRAVRQAMQISGQQVEKPVVIADVQDNAGAGGTADTTGLLQALIDARATGAVVGVLCDSPVAQLAHAGGKGSIVRAPLGAKSGLPGHLPVIASWQVQVLSDGNIAYTGQMYGGVTAEIGASCLLSLHESDIDLQVVVSSCRTQCLDQALFRHFGVELSSKRIIVVKSTVHYRADFDPICSAVINAAADGSFVCDLSLVQYQKLRPEIRLGPSNNAVTGTIER